MTPLAHGGFSTLLVSLAIAGFATFRMLRERRMQLNRLWVFPALLLVLSAASLWASVSQSLVTALLCLLALVLGAGVGELGARSQRVRLDPQHPGAVFVQGSPLTVALFLGAFVVRSVVRATIGGEPLHGPLSWITGALLTFSLGMILARTARLYLRASHLRAA